MSASNDPDPKPRLDAPGAGKPAWYQNVRFVMVLLVLAGLFALPLVWINRTMTLKKKIVITVVSVLIAIALYWVSDKLFKSVQWKQLTAQQTRESALSPSNL